MNIAISMLRTGFVGLCLVVALALGMAAPASAQKTGTPLEVDGQAWVESGRPEKLAFLYGASSIIAIELDVAKRQKSKGSPFVEGWMKAFGDMTPEQVCGILDNWYAQHPQDMKRHVYEVLWNEYIVPRLGK